MVEVGGNVHQGSDPLSVGIMPLNWFVSFSGLTSMPIYSDSRSLPRRLGIHLAKQRVVFIHKHTQTGTPAKERCAVMYMCTVAADCWFYSLYASSKEASTHCFRFHRMAFLLSSAECRAWPERQTEITQSDLQVPLRGKNNHILITARTLWLDLQGLKMDACRYEHAQIQHK